MKRLIVVGCVVVILLTGGVASASEVTAMLTVRATIVPVCAVSTLPVDFGAYEGFDKNAEGAIGVTCSPGAPYEIKLGTGYSGTYDVRKMMLWGYGELDYNLYTDSTRTTIWGDGTADTQTVSATGTGAAVTHVVYGKVFGGQTVPPGDYIDYVLVTVDF